MLLSEETAAVFFSGKEEGMNVFEAVKQSVTTRQAAEYYGIRVNRNGMAVCPFHNDKNPSMKVDRRFHCFGCQADGDVIDFAAKLYNLSSKEAAIKVAEDFSVSYDAMGHGPPVKKPVRKKISEELRFRQAQQQCFRVLSDYYHLLKKWKTEYVPGQEDMQWHPLFVEAQQRREYIGYLLDTLLSGTMEEKVALIAEQGKEVMQIEQRISGFATSHKAGCHECSRLARTGTDGW